MAFTVRKLFHVNVSQSEGQIFDDSLEHSYWYLGITRVILDSKAAILTGLVLKTSDFRYP